MCAPLSAIYFCMLSCHVCIQCVENTMKIRQSRYAEWAQDEMPDLARRPSWAEHNPLDRVQSISQALTEISAPLSFRALNALNHAISNAPGPGFSRGRHRQGQRMPEALPGSASGCSSLRHSQVDIQNSDIPPDARSVEACSWDSHRHLPLLTIRRIPCMLL